MEDVLELTLWPSRAALWSRYRLQKPVSELVLNLDRSTAWQKVKTKNAKMRRMDFIGDKRNFKPLRRKFCHFFSFLTEKHSNSNCKWVRSQSAPKMLHRILWKYSKSFKTPLNSKLQAATVGCRLDLTRHGDIPANIYISGQYGQYGQYGVQYCVLYCVCKTRDKSTEVITTLQSSTAA